MHDPKGNRIALAMFAQWDHRWTRRDAGGDDGVCNERRRDYIRPGVQTVTNNMTNPFLTIKRLRQKGEQGALEKPKF